MWGAIGIFLFFVGIAFVQNGWPKFITINHYHSDKKDDKEE